MVYLYTAVEILCVCVCVCVRVRVRVCERERERERASSSSLYILNFDPPDRLEQLSKKSLGDNDRNRANDRHMSIWLHFATWAGQTYVLSVLSNQSAFFQTAP